MIKFDHMNLPVSDPKRSRDWYVGNFGFEVEFEVAERGIIAIKDSADFTIFLCPPEASLTGAKCGLTLQVDNVDAMYDQLKARGLTFTSPPATYFWGYGAELRDPDGYQILLWDEATMREKSKRT